MLSHQVVRPVCAEGSKCKRRGQPSVFSWCRLDRCPSIGFPTCTVLCRCPSESLTLCSGSTYKPTPLTRSNCQRTSLAPQSPTLTTRRKKPVPRGCVAAASQFLWRPLSALPASPAWGCSRWVPCRRLWNTWQKRSCPLSAREPASKKRRRGQRPQSWRRSKPKQRRGRRRKKPPRPLQRPVARRSLRPSSV